MEAELSVVRDGGEWRIGPAAASDAVALANEYLSYLADRNYSPQTVRAYAFSLLPFCRWLAEEAIPLDAVTTDVLLRFLAFCRQASVPGRPGPNVVRMDGQRANRFAPATINHRLAAISGMFSFRQMRDPEARNPVPKGKESRRLTTGERAGLLAHVDRRPRYRSPLRLREPRRLPRSLDRRELAALVGSLRSLRDRAIAGLMVFCGLRAGEVLSLQVKDVDIGGRWLLVHGKGSKERRVPLDVEVAGMVQTYVLAERPETTSSVLFVVAKGPHRGQPLTPAGLRRIAATTGRRPASRPAIPTLCATPSGPRSQKPAWTWRSCRRCWATPTSTPPRAMSPRPRPRQGRVRCRSPAPARASLNLGRGTSSPTTPPTSSAPDTAMSAPRRTRGGSCAGSPIPSPGPASRFALASSSTPTWPRSSAS